MSACALADSLVRLGSDITDCAGPAPNLFGLTQYDNKTSFYGNGGPLGPLQSAMQHAR